MSRYIPSRESPPLANRSRYLREPIIYNAHERYPYVERNRDRGHMYTDNTRIRDRTRYDDAGDHPWGGVNRYEDDDLHNLRHGRHRSDGDDLLRERYRHRYENYDLPRNIYQRDTEYHDPRPLDSRGVRSRHSLYDGEPTGIYRRHQLGNDYVPPVDQKGVSLKFDVKVSGEQEVLGTNTTRALEVKRVKEMCIGSSRGYNDDDGLDTIVLMMDLKASSNISHIRWIHMQHEYMSLDSLQSLITHSAGLKPEDVLIALRLLRKVQENNEKQYIHGYYLEPLVIRCDGQDARDPKEGERHCTFLSFPYFSFQYAQSNETQGVIRPHPAKGLLQKLYYLESTKCRDAEQAINKLHQSNDRRAVHVPEIWSIVFGSGKYTIITYSSQSLSKIRGKKIQIRQPISSIRTSPSVLRVTNPYQRLYFFSIDQCRTWFELTELLSTQCLGDSYSLLSEYDLLLKDKRRVTGASWSTILSTETSAFIDLFITPPIGREHNPHRRYHEGLYGEPELISPRVPSYYDRGDPALRYDPGFYKKISKEASERERIREELILQQLREQDTPRRTEMGLRRQREDMKARVDDDIEEDTQRTIYEGHAEYNDIEHGKIPEEGSKRPVDRSLVLYDDGEMKAIKEEENRIAEQKSADYDNENVEKIANPRVEWLDRELRRERMRQQFEEDLRMMGSSQHIFPPNQTEERIRRMLKDNKEEMVNKAVVKWGTKAPEDFQGEEDEGEKQQVQSSKSNNLEDGQDEIPQNFNPDKDDNQAETYRSDSIMAVVQIENNQKSQSGSRASNLANLKSQYSSVPVGENRARYQSSRQAGYFNERPKEYSQGYVSRHDPVVSRPIFPRNASASGYRGTIATEGSGIIINESKIEDSLPVDPDIYYIPESDNQNDPRVVITSESLEELPSQGPHEGEQEPRLSSTANYFPNQSKSNTRQSSRSSGHSTRSSRAETTQKPFVLPILMWPTGRPDVEDSNEDDGVENLFSKFINTARQSRQNNQNGLSGGISGASRNIHMQNADLSLAEVLKGIHERLKADSVNDHSTIYEDTQEAPPDEAKFTLHSDEQGLEAEATTSKNASRHKNKGKSASKTSGGHSLNIDDETLKPGENLRPTKVPEYKLLLQQFSERASGILEAFAPPGYPSTVIGRYYGAVKNIIYLVQRSHEHDLKGREARQAKRDNNDIFWMIQDVDPGEMELHKLPHLSKLPSDCRRCTTNIYATFDSAASHMRQVHFSRSRTRYDPDYPPSSIISHWIKRFDRVSDRRRCDEHFRTVQECNVNLIALQSDIQDIQNGVSTNEQSHQPRYRLPKALVVSFRAIVLFLIYASHVLQLIDRHSTESEGSSWDPARDRELTAAQGHLHLLGLKAEDVLERGKFDLKLMIRTRDYTQSVTYEAVGPQYILAMVLSNLQLGIDSQDLLEVYKEYTHRLAFHVSQRPRKRLLRDFLAILEEINAICATLEMQATILTNYKTVLAPHSFRATTFSRISMYSLEARLLQRSLTEVRRKLDQYRQLEQQARRHINLAKMGIEILDDDHGKAILVFTIVTLVFLPLSFVTGFLGMNTNDMRNSDADQTLFWEVALPLTAVVIGLSLLIGYKYDSMGEWFGRSGRREKSSR